MIIEVPRLKEILNLIPQKIKNYNFYSPIFDDNNNYFDEIYIKLTKSNCYCKNYTTLHYIPYYRPNFYNFTISYNYKYLIINKPVRKQLIDKILKYFHKEYIYLKYAYGICIPSNKLNKKNQDLLSLAMKRIEILFNSKEGILKSLNNNIFSKYSYSIERKVKYNINQIYISSSHSNNEKIIYRIEQYQKIKKIYISKLFVNNEKLLTKILQQFIFQDMVGKI